MGNLKEKCKKLIVKVKQQDAQIKRKARDSTSSEASTVVNDDIELLSEENEKLKKENMEFKKMYEEFSTSSGQEIEKLKNEIEYIKKSQGVDLEDIKRENMELKEKFDDIETKIKSQETDFQKKNSKLEEMTAKYQIIEDLQNQLSQKEADCEKWERECNAKENILIQKETEKDDIIRNLKQKLEDAPEDISIPVNIAEATLAHEKTKTELLNLKEKCKKLIVKVK